MPFITTDVDLAVDDLRAGKPVAIPTETVYGLAAPINNEQAIKAVFSMKNRPLNHPLIVHVAANWDLSTLVSDIPAYAKQLMHAFWPGPLTLVLPCAPGQINPLINGGQTTVAIRCPAHPIAQEVLQKLQVPVVAPSANPFGKVSPTTALHVQESFAQQTLTILDGGRCTVGIESTIVNASDPQHYQILRHGLLDEQTLAQATSTQFDAQHSTIRVPGKLDSHYQPQKTLYYFASYAELAHFCQQSNEPVYAIASNQPAKVQAEHYHVFAQDPQTAAYDLYFQLRMADASSALCIAIELPAANGLWQGIRERILKAGIAYSE